MSNPARLSIECSSTDTEEAYHVATSLSSSLALQSQTAPEDVSPVVTTVYLDQAQRRESMIKLPVSTHCCSDQASAPLVIPVQLDSGDVTNDNINYPASSDGNRTAGQSNDSNEEQHIYTLKVLRKHIFPALTILLFLLIILILLWEERKAQNIYNGNVYNNYHTQHCPVAFEAFKQQVQNRLKKAESNVQKLFDSSNNIEKILNATDVKHRGNKLIQKCVSLEKTVQSKAMSSSSSRIDKVYPKCPKAEKMDMCPKDGFQGNYADARSLGEDKYALSNMSSSHGYQRRMDILSLQPLTSVQKSNVSKSGRIFAASNVLIQNSALRNYRYIQVQRDFKSAIVPHVNSSHHQINLEELDKQRQSKDLIKSCMTQDWTALSMQGDSACKPAMKSVNGAGLVSVDLGLGVLKGPVSNLIWMSILSTSLFLTIVTFVLKLWFSLRRNGFLAAVKVGLQNTWISINYMVEQLYEKAIAVIFLNHGPGMLGVMFYCLMYFPDVEPIKKAESTDSGIPDSGRSQCLSAEEQPVCKHRCQKQAEASKPYMIPAVYNFSKTETLSKSNVTKSSSESDPDDTRPAHEASETVGSHVSSSISDSSADESTDNEDSLDMPGNLENPLNVQHSGQNFSILAEPAKEDEKAITQNVSIVSPDVSPDTGPKRISIFGQEGNIGITKSSNDLMPVENGAPVIDQPKTEDLSPVHTRVDFTTVELVEGTAAKDPCTFIGVTAKYSLDASQKEGNISIPGHSNYTPVGPQKHSHDSEHPVVCTHGSNRVTHSDNPSVPSGCQDDSFPRELSGNDNNTLLPGNPDDSAIIEQGSSDDSVYESPHLDAVHGSSPDVEAVLNALCEAVAAEVDTAGTDTVDENPRLEAAHGSSPDVEAGLHDLCEAVAAEVGIAGTDTVGENPHLEGGHGSSPDVEAGLNDLCEAVAAEVDIAGTDSIDESPHLHAAHGSSPDVEAVLNDLCEAVAAEVDIADTDSIDESPHHDAAHGSSSDVEAVLNDLCKAVAAEVDIAGTDSFDESSHLDAAHGSSSDVEADAVVDDLSEAVAARARAVVAGVPLSGPDSCFITGRNPHSQENVSGVGQPSLLLLLEAVKELYDKYELLTPELPQRIRDERLLSALVRPSKRQYAWPHNSVVCGVLTNMMNFLLGIISAQNQTGVFLQCFQVYHGGVVTVLSESRKLCIDQRGETPYIEEQIELGNFLQKRLAYEMYISHQDDSPDILKVYGVTKSITENGCHYVNIFYECREKIEYINVLIVYKPAGCRADGQWFRVRKGLSVKSVLAKPAVSAMVTYLKQKYPTLRPNHYIRLLLHGCQALASPTWKLNHTCILELIPTLNLGRCPVG